MGYLGGWVLTQQEKEKLLNIFRLFYSNKKQKNRKLRYFED